MKAVAVVLGALVVFPLALLSVLTGSGQRSSRGGLAPMPAAFRGLYVAAAATCPGLPVEVLMAIGEVESGHGANDGPSSAGAVGPMQFEITTFAEYATPVPPGGADPASAWDPPDAIYAAARLLCANGALGGADIPGAIWAYNHDPAYVADVLAVAAQYTAQDVGSGGAPAPLPVTTTTTPGGA